MFEVEERVLPIGKADHDSGHGTPRSMLRRHRSNLIAEDTEEAIIHNQKEVNGELNDDSNAKHKTNIDGVKLNIAQTVINITKRVSKRFYLLALCAFIASRIFLTKHHHDFGVRMIINILPEKPPPQTDDNATDGVNKYHSNWEKKFNQESNQQTRQLPHIDTQSRNAENIPNPIQPYPDSRPSTFPWDRDNICHVVENICNVHRSRWMYFTDDDSSRKPKQPSQFSVLPERIGPYISPEWAKESISQLLEKKCTISNVTNHIVVTGKHIYMLGEYYQRVLLPLHHLMQDYMAYSNTTFSNEKEVQFYIHFSKQNQKILDSHFLYTMGLPFGDNVKSWMDTISSVNSCQCYRRLVLCGYTYHNSVPKENETKLTLRPHHRIPDNFEKHCDAGYSKKAKALENQQCNIWQDLRVSLIKMYESTHPNLHHDIQAYRKHLVAQALQAYFPGESYLQQDWKIVGLSQRSDRRKWININEVMTHCNNHYHLNGIVCVEVDVANLPTSFIDTGRNQSLTAVEEQLVLYRSIDALVGIHGSQLTQGVLMQSNSVVVELMPWLPPPTHWNIPVFGDGWVNQKNHPTAMGIMWHNTDINEAGYELTRESVPLCQGISDFEMHNFSGEELPNYYHMKDGANITELEYCLQVTHAEKFAWDVRDFQVPIDFVHKFIDTFFPFREQTDDLKYDSNYTCNSWRERGKRNGFVMFNLWCPESYDGDFSAHHYYQH